MGISCSEENNNDIYYGISQSTSVDISIVDEQGNDLLDPDNLNRINTSTVELYHIVDGEQLKFFYGHLDYSEGYRVYNPGDLGFNDNYLFCVMHTCGYGAEKDDTMPVTYIKWANNDIDTLQCKYEISDYEVFCTKVWFIGELVWTSPGENGESRWFQTIK